MTKSIPATGQAIADMILNAWNTNHRVTIFLVENLLAALWPETIPGMPRRTIRSSRGVDA